MAKNLKITVFGDSIAKGIVFRDNRYQVAQDNVIALLERHYNVSIENTAQFGQTLRRINDRQLVQRYLRRIDETENNLAVFCIGGNDCSFDWNSVQHTPSEAHTSATTPAEFFELLKENVSLLQSRGVHVMILNLPPLDSEEYFRKYIAEKYDPERVMSFLKEDLANIYRHQEFFSLMLTKFALTNGCSLADIRSRFLWKNDMRELLCEDGIHLNERGQRVMAEAIVDEVSRDPYFAAFELKAASS